MTTATSRRYLPARAARRRAYWPRAAVQRLSRYRCVIAIGIPSRLTFRSIMCRCVSAMVGHGEIDLA